MATDPQDSLNRRSFLSACTKAGVASALLPGVLYTLATQAETAQAQAQGKELPKEMPKITPELLDEAAALAGVTLSAEQKTMMLDGLNDQRSSYEPIRVLKMPNSIAPAFIFDPLPPGAKLDTSKAEPKWSTAASSAAPANLEDLAFASLRDLAELIKTRKVTSLALTQMYLARLKRYDSKLHFVITLTEDRALAQAKAADAEIAAGKYRGPLHGIP